MFQVKQSIPYDRNHKDVVKASKEINKYITGNLLPLKKKVGKKYFAVFLKGIPADKREQYKRDGIPFNFKTKDDSEVQYILVE